MNSLIIYAILSNPQVLLIIQRDTSSTATYKLSTKTPQIAA
jgi:hypothetical protein